MPQINLLGREVYELIAAGEVIERPASIVKELIENSIDSGADSIAVEIKNGGRIFLRVTDNGCGIAFEDVPKAFLRHATSKVSGKDDLDRIITLGFRGEALASLCAVARVEMFTRQSGQPLGTHYEIAASEEKLCEETGCPEGTSIIVRDLFYNVPARLKFLKKDATEATRIQELISRLAVSRPDISIKFIRDNKPIFVTAGDGKLFSALYSVFGRDFAGGLLPVSYERDGVTAEGFVSKPLNSRTNRKFQLFYINDRYVHSEVCSQALEEAYRSRMMVGKFPMCVLKLNIPPEMLDVNVHPAKTEVRFSDNRYVYDSVYFAVRQALEEKDKPSHLTIYKPKRYSDSELYVQPDEPQPQQLEFTAEPTPSQEHEGDDLFLQSLERQTRSSGSVVPLRTELVGAGDIPEPNRLEDDEFAKMLDGMDMQGEADMSVDAADDPPYTTDTAGENKSVDMPDEGFKYVSAEDFKRKPVRVSFDPEPQEDKPKLKPLVIGELFKTYIVAQAGDEMVLIDKHAAHERHIYENIRFDAKNITAQLLLEPIMVTLSFDEYDAISAYAEKIERLGFMIEPDVAPTIAVKALPQLIKQFEPTEMITEIARKLIGGSGDPSPQLYDDIYRSMACKAAIKAHDDNSIKELQHLAELVFEEDLRYCPHGRPVMLKMSEYEIEKHFRRIV